MYVNYIFPWPDRRGLFSVALNSEALAAENLCYGAGSASCWPAASKRILLIADGSLGSLLKKLIEKYLPDTWVKLATPYTHTELVYRELFLDDYRMIILTNSGFLPVYIPEIAEDIKECLPDIKIVVFSGYTDPHFITDLMDISIDWFQPLPFRIEEAKDKLREMLQ